MANNTSGEFVPALNFNSASRYLLMNEVPEKSRRRRRVGTGGVIIACQVTSLGSNTSVFDHFFCCEFYAAAVCEGRVCGWSRCVGRDGAERGD